MKYNQNNIPQIKENYVYNLLRFRGIDDPTGFIYPSESNKNSPFLLSNMQQAIEIVNKHINDKIALLIDCDCDGFTSAAIMYQYLKRINPEANITYFIHDGKAHGLEDMLDNISFDFDLLIIPDASSNDYDLHKEYYDNGVEIVILDHHEADKLSEYACVVNNQFNNYPNKDLTGACVAYKFCEGYDITYGFNYSHDYVDLAAVGIIGDMASLLNLETRYIIEDGLNHITNIFLETLIMKQAYSIGGQKINPTVISFYIVPMINALIRVGKASEKEIMFRAFIEGDEAVQSTKRGAPAGQMESIADQATRNCTNAKSRQNRAKEKALDMLKVEVEKNCLDDNKIMIIPVEDPNIDTTLTGLIAMQLVSYYHKPVLLGRSTTDNHLRGSVRNVGKSAITDLRQFLIDSGYFTYAEGHAGACGFDMPIVNIDKFIEYANYTLKDIDFSESVYNVDFVRTANDTDIANLVFDICSYPTIWGKDMEEPYIVIKDIMLTQDDISIMGSNKDTIKFRAGGVEFIKFHATELIEKISQLPTFTITVLGRAQVNNFMGNETAQISIDDYNIETNYFDF